MDLVGLERTGRSHRFRQVLEGKHRGCWFLDVHHRRLKERKGSVRLLRCCRYLRPATGIGNQIGGEVVLSKKQDMAL